MRVPDELVLGAATSSYQIEGGWQDDGKGPSIWDTFCHQGGHVRGGDTGDVACDHYHRLDEDLDLMADYGLQAYRFSISWPRVLPGGTGRVNQAGLDFYRRLVDGLLQRGITPVATLYHWDLPQALQDRGGWGERDSSAWFAEYATTCADALGDRIQDWTTLNEQHVIAMLGHAAGIFAPGATDPALALRAAHHLSLAHGLGCQAIRDRRPAARMSIVHNITAARPASDRPDDVAATRDWHTVVNEIYLGPQLDGAYPERLLELTAPVTDWGFVRDGDLATIRQPLDAFGLNYYTRYVLAAGRKPAGVPSDEVGLDHVVQVPPAEPRTDIGWTVDADGLQQQVEWMARRAPGIPLWITENGAAYDEPVRQGRVRDQRRVRYLREHLEAVLRARGSGAPVAAYFAWSLMDNFEWAEGYSQRFGLTHVDYDTLQRTPKDSGRWFAAVIRERNTRVDVPQ